MRALQGFMDSGTPLRIWLGLSATAVLVPLLFLVHELGHAAVALVLTDGRVRVRVGRDPAWVDARVGRLSLELSGQFRRGERPGEAVALAPLVGAGRAAYALGGPAASLLLAALLALVAAGTGGIVRVAAICTAAVSAEMGIANLMPRRGTDGSSAVAALRRRAHPPAPATFLDTFRETQARWLALLRRPPEEQLADRLARGVRRLTRPVSDVAAARLGHVAAAGWYWRAAEQGGNAPLEPTPSALEAAILVVERGVELGLGSPGRNPRERVELLKRGFDSLPPAFRSPDLAPDDARRAFLLGVALHDQERLAPQRRLP